MEEKQLMVTRVKPTRKEKQYLVCLDMHNDNMPQEWIILNDRKETYDYIKDILENEIIDLNTSFVLVDTLTLKDRISVYSFMHYSKMHYFKNDKFDINDYVKGDWDEREYEESNEIINDFNIDNSEKLTMESIMNGDIKLGGE